MDTDTEARPLRFCDACGELDDHPRHVVAGVTNGKPSAEVLAGFTIGDAPGAAVAQLFDSSIRVRHLNCCAADGCPVCAETEKLTKGKRGGALLTAIQGGALDGFDAPDIELTQEGN